MAEVPAGWYPDPASDDQICRWWTSAGWTDLLSSDPDAPPPPPDARLRLVTPAPRRKPARRRVALVISTVVVAVLLVGAATAGNLKQGPVLPRGAIPTGAASTAAPAWSMAADHTLRFGSVATGMLPGKPFPDPTQPKPLFGFAGQATYVSLVVEKPDWSAVVLTGSVDSDLVADSPLSTAGSVLSHIQMSEYENLKTTPSDQQVTPVAGLGADVACQLSVRLNYTKPGIRSRYDEVKIIVFRVDPAHFSMWFSNVPEFSAASVKTAVETARASITRT